jgi:hypothetical protein
MKGDCVAIDGSKFNAINSRDRNFTQGRIAMFVKADFLHDPELDVYRCPAGETLT